MQAQFSKRLVGVWCMLAMAVCLTLGLTACGPAAETKGSEGSSAPAETAKTVVFTDDLGREVEVPTDVEKIVPSGHTANMVLLTIAPEKMVGLSQEMSELQAKYVGDRVADDLPVLGAIFGAKGDLNKEAVAATGAELLIDTGEVKEGAAEDLDELQEQLGIPCVFVESYLEDWGSAYRTLGELLGEEERGEELASYCDEAYESVSKVMEGIPEADRVSALLCTGETGTNVLAKTSFQAGVVDMLANNVAVVDNPAGSGMGNESSLEQIAVWDPEVLLFNGLGKDAVDQLVADPAWQSLTAVQNGTYFAVPSTPYNWLNQPPTVNQVLGMQWLSHLLYPEQFDDSAEDVVKSYFKTFFDYDLTDEELSEIAPGALSME